MKAWRVHENGDYRDALRLEDVESPPAPGPRQALLRIRAVGLNFADLLSIEGRYQVRAPLPFTPGIEAVGTVVARGADCPFEQGSRVVVTPPWGALCEYLLAEPELCYPVPASMSDADAAAFVLTYQTSYFALVLRGLLQPGEFVLVHNGAGGVGSAAIQIAKACGGVVAATAGGSEKLEICRRSGADHLIDYRSGDFVAEVQRLTEGRGADVIYDSVGGDVFDASTRCIAMDGRLLVVGFAGGRIPTIAANRIMLKNIAIVGLNWGAYRDRHSPAVTEAHRALTRLYEEGRLAPVLFRTYPFEALPEALGDLQGRRSFGKLVVELDGTDQTSPRRA